MYLGPNFLPAAFGLLGVIVGGFITAVSSYVMDEKRSERERQREKRERSIEITRAARMIDADFSDALACASLALENNYYWDPDYVPLTVKGWDDYAAILAAAVVSEPWLKIRLGVDAVQHLNSYREMDAQTAGANATFPALSSNLKQGVGRAADDLVDARETLAPLCFESRADERERMLFDP